MLSTFWDHARRSQGQAAIFLILFVFLFGVFGAAVVDVGFLLNARRDAQGDADNSALAGALELSLSSDPAVQQADEARAITQAIAWTTMNGVPADASVSVAPVDTCFSASDGLATGVQVTIEREVPSFFMGLLGVTDWSVGATAVACSSGRDIAVVVDRSGSMCDDSQGGTTLNCPPAPTPWEPFNSVQAAAISFARNFSPVYDQMALVSYSTSASTDLALGNDFGPGSAFEDAVGDMHPSGYTNIRAAILLARQQLTGPSAQPGAARIMVLLTDGVPNRPSNETTGKSQAIDEAKLSADAGIRIYVIGLGDNVDHAFLQQIATIGGGLYLPAPAASDLEAAFQTIADLAHARLTH